jgi:hypothetical protein
VAGGVVALVRAATRRSGLLIFGFSCSGPWWARRSSAATASAICSSTSTTHGILTRIAQYGWPVWVADGKGVEFLGFRDWPNVQIVASRIEQQVAVIRRAWELMEYRYKLVVDGLARSEDFTPLVVFVDEFTDLKGNLLSWYAGIKIKGDPTKPPTLSELGSIARKGRTARVHLVLAMQRPRRGNSHRRGPGTRHADPDADRLDNHGRRWSRRRRAQRGRPASPGCGHVPHPRGQAVLPGDLLRWFHHRH